MRCQDVLCAYYLNEKCRLDEVEIDEMGMCMECIHVAFDAQELARRREETYRFLNSLSELHYNRRGH